MKKTKKKDLKQAFKNYINAGQEEKNCAEPCLKNGKSDRYCFDCASDILEPIIPKK